jgi:hypothetical protein
MEASRAKRIAREYFEGLPRDRDLSLIDRLLAAGRLSATRDRDLPHRR